MTAMTQRHANGMDRYLLLRNVRAHLSGGA